MKPRKINPVLLENIRALRRASKTNQARIWAAIAERLEDTGRNRAEVNLSRINRVVHEGETAAVPGKVLGSGRIDHNVTVAAFEFSVAARARIIEGGGKPMTIMQLLKENPKGSSVRIVG